MPKEFQGEVIPPKENKKENDLRKYEAGIMNLLEKYKETKRVGTCPEWTETVNFDISNPHNKDMEKFWSGDFEITNFSVLEVKGEIKGFNFYIGETEFIIRGEAADKVSASLENKENR